MTHADKLEYGWWEKKAQPLPDTVVHTNNYVLTIEEMQRYQSVLHAMEIEIAEERENVACTLRALKRGSVQSWESRIPQLPTLCSVMEFYLVMGKARLTFMHFVNDFTKRCVDMKKGSETSEHYPTP